MQLKKKKDAQLTAGSALWSLHDVKGTWQQLEKIWIKGGKKSKCDKIDSLISHKIAGTSLWCHKGHSYHSRDSTWRNMGPFMVMKVHIVYCSSVGPKIWVTGSSSQSGTLAAPVIFSSAAINQEFVAPWESTTPPLGFLCFLCPE